MTMNSIEVFFAAFGFVESESIESFKIGGQSFASLKAGLIKRRALLWISCNNHIEVSVRIFSL